MQANLPVTQREYQFPDSETLLSTADTSSISMGDLALRVVAAVQVFSV